MAIKYWMARFCTILTLGVLATPSLSAAKSHDMSPNQARNHADVRQLTGDQLRERINHDTSLSEQHRVQMLGHLQECLDLGVSPLELEAIFPSPHIGQSLDNETMLRMQVRVHDMLRENMDAGLVLEKMHEGRVKGVPSQRIEDAAIQMEGHIRAAHRFLGGSRDANIEPPKSGEEHRVLERHLALDLWSGLEEGDLDHLRQRGRLRDGSCTASDLVAAADVASIVHHRGIERRRSMELVGYALEVGYTAREMRMLGAMMTASHLSEHGDEVLQHLHDGMNHHRQLGQMAEEMMSWGWMGPAGTGDGADWHHMIDDWMGGGPGDHHDGDDEHMGGGHGHGGMNGGGGMGG
jgi:hypothetical protein